MNIVTSHILNVLYVLRNYVPNFSIIDYKVDMIIVDVNKNGLNIVYIVVYVQYNNIKVNLVTKNVVDPL